MDNRFLISQEAKHILLELEVLKFNLAIECFIYFLAFSLFSSILVSGVGDCSVDYFYTNGGVRKMKLIVFNCCYLDNKQFGLCLFFNVF